eukprot:190899-Chlamydomonas_euryale.AAC.9
MGAEAQRVRRRNGCGGARCETAVCRRVSEPGRCVQGRSDAGAGLCLSRREDGRTKTAEGGGGQCACPQPTFGTFCPGGVSNG